MEFWQPNTLLGGIMHIKRGRSRREFSWDGTGGNRDFYVVPAGEICVLTDI